jgi:hypothetical protein
MQPSNKYLIKKQKSKKTMAKKIKKWFKNKETNNNH